MTTAVLSPCEKYRYSLKRKIVDDNYVADKGTFAIVMLNPSTADATIDDPTIRRCMGFAKDLGYADLHVVNLYAYPRSLAKPRRTKGSSRPCRDGE